MKAWPPLLQLTMSAASARTCVCEYDNGGRMGRGDEAWSMSQRVERDDDGGWVTRAAREYLNSKAPRCGWEGPAAPLGHATDGPHSALHYHLREFSLYVCADPTTQESAN